jgi:hypothetical protein
MSRVLVVYYRTKQGPDSEWADTLWTLSMNVSLARSAFRLFRWIGEFVTFWDSFRAGFNGQRRIGPLWFFSSLRGLAIGTFILMNNLYWALNWKLLVFTSASNMKRWASYHIRHIIIRAGILN